MSVAIIGLGRMGRGLARRLAAAGETVMLCGRDDLKAAAEATAISGRVSSGPIASAAGCAVVVLAVPYSETTSALRAAGDLSGKIVVDITNPVGPGLSLAIGLTTSAAEEAQKLVPGASVVKAFNTLFAPLLETEFGPDDIPPQVIYAGDDETAKKEVARLIKAIGFAALDGGPLRNARLIEPLGLLTIQFGYALGKGTRFSPRFVAY